MHQTSNWGSIVILLAMSLTAIAQHAEERTEISERELRDAEFELQTLELEHRMTELAVEEGELELKKMEFEQRQTALRVEMRRIQSQVARVQIEHARSRLEQMREQLKRDRQRGTDRSDFFRRRSRTSERRQVPRADRIPAEIREIYGRLERLENRISEMTESRSTDEG